ncbi:hypothetical protein GCM10025876_34310 [Demequina litorisediminis]|uniref:Uncharacterized protein n=1 Tax=Demequina litorisediminis TaxID=1849022 RepID=A0ABQ6IH28_9MICO|nr:hypothetical protein GCM10025876_34310 [Demequina litorisediminis]
MGEAGVLQLVEGSGGGDGGEGLRNGRVDGGTVEGEISVMAAFLRSSGVWGKSIGGRARRSVRWIPSHRGAYTSQMDPFGAAKEVKRDKINRGKARGFSPGLDKQRRCGAHRSGRLPAHGGAGHNGLGLRARAHGAHCNAPRGGFCLIVALRRTKWIHLTERERV